MATNKQSPPPVSPTVAAVFEDFLARTANDETLGKEVADRLRAALLKQGAYDPDNLLLAVFGDEAL